MAVNFELDNERFFVQGAPAKGVDALIDEIIVFDLESDLGYKPHLLGGFRPSSFNDGED